MADSSSSDVESESQTEGDGSHRNILQNGVYVDKESSASEETVTEAACNSSDGNKNKVKVENCDNDSITDVTELSQDEQNSFSGGKKKDQSNKSSKLKFPKLDFQSDWYNHKCFHGYWEHYSQVMAWCQKHYQTYYSLHNNYMFTSPPSPWQHPYWPMFPWYQGQNAERQSPDQRKKRNRNRRSRQRARKIKEEMVMEETGTQTADSEAFEMEITQDMIDFFSKSHEHRKQRDEEKREAVEKEAMEPDHINVEDVKIGSVKVLTEEAPKERPGSRRTAEMKTLYGKGAPMIHGMETAIQMTYDRNVDVKQPKLWPNMPLKVIFG